MNILIGIVFILVVIIGAGIIGYIIYKGVTQVIKEIKEYFKERNALETDDQLIVDAVMWVILLVAITYFVDSFNWLDKLGISKNLTKDYDWLSFVGTIASALLSALLLIVITRKERTASNRILAKSQRPYLNIDFITQKTNAISNISNETYSNNNEMEEGVEIPCLKITNVGQTAAIIDVDSSFVNVRYEVLKNLSKGKERISNKNKKIILNSVIKRISIPSEKTVYILFDDEEFNIPLLIGKININECYIKYKDLFGYEYEDKSFCKNGKIEIEVDNKTINEIF